MNWLILVTLTFVDSFLVFNKEFEHENACVEYVNNPDNYNTLAIEIIAVAGFNDPVTDIICIPEYEESKEGIDG